MFNGLRISYHTYNIDIDVAANSANIIYQEDASGN